MESINDGKNKQLEVLLHKGELTPKKVPRCKQKMATQRRAPTMLKRMKR